MDPTCSHKNMSLIPLLMIRKTKEQLSDEYYKVLQTPDEELDIERVTYPQLGFGNEYKYNTITTLKDYGRYGAGTTYTFL